MKEPDKLYLQPEVTFDLNNILGHRNSYDTEYIRKDVVDETIKSAEDHAYFAGQEKLREKLLEWLEQNRNQSQMWFDRYHEKEDLSAKQVWEEVINKLNSI